MRLQCARRRPNDDQRGELVMWGYRDAKLAEAQKAKKKHEADLEDCFADLLEIEERSGAKAAADSRIRFLEPLPNDQVPERLREYDALAVPSVGFETGPLTVYDAFAAGIPVIGSRRGGTEIGPFLFR